MIFVASVKMILSRLVQKVTNKYHLLFYYSKKGLINVDSNTKLRLNKTGSSLLYKTNSKFFSRRALKSLMHS